MTEKYIPKIGDQVFLDGHAFVRYVVATVNESKETARVKNVTGSPVVLSGDVPWLSLLPLDESQVAARIVKENAEGK